MTAREIESVLLSRCCLVARDSAQIAQDQREANVFRLASMVIQSRFPVEADNLWRASEHYLANHPGEKLDPADVVRKAWIIDLPRLRDRLIRQLAKS